MPVLPWDPRCPRPDPPRSTRRHAGSTSAPAQTSLGANGSTRERFGSASRIAAAKSSSSETVMLSAFVQAPPAMNILADQDAPTSKNFRDQGSLTGISAVLRERFNPDPQVLVPSGSGNNGRCGTSLAMSAIDAARSWRKVLLRASRCSKMCSYESARNNA